MDSTYSAEVVIIGGGVAGISAAIKLAQHSHVLLIEQKQLFWGSSGRNPGRMGHGFHYIDFETAKMYLHASISVQRNYPDFLIGKDLPFEHPIRHGRYFITKSSDYSFEEVMQTYRLLQAEYAALVAEDSLNEVFGPPEQFFRVLDADEYADYINIDIVQGAVETAEHLFDWPAFSEHIRQVIETHPRISLLENNEVIDIIPRPDKDTRFHIITQSNQADAAVKSLTIPANFIVNSAWENIDYLNQMAGSRYINRMRTNRLKCLLEVQLPETLQHKNSAFFCMGSFCMFSNLGDGRGMMTLADVTNMASSFAVRIDSEMERYIRGDISIQEKIQIASEIQAGVAQYIPEIANATMMDVKFGIVQTKGELNLCDLLDPKSSHHIRNYLGVREEYQGLISNPAMKFFYFLENGNAVNQFYLKQKLREPIQKEIYRLMMEAHDYPWKKLFRNDFKRAIPFIIDRMLIEERENPAEIARQMSQTIYYKFDLHKYIFLAQQLVSIAEKTSPYLAVKALIRQYSKNFITILAEEPGFFFDAPKEEGEECTPFVMIEPFSFFKQSYQVQRTTPLPRVKSISWLITDEASLAAQKIDDRPKSVDFFAETEEDNTPFYTIECKGPY